MAHELSIRSNGQVEYAGAIGTGAWHGLGQEIDPKSTIEQWIVAAGMDWKVQRSKVRYMVDAAGTAMEWPEQHILFRSDSKAPLASVSDGFQIVQPKQVMEFFRDLCATNHFTMRTAGVLFGGKRFWALADIGEESYVADKRDRVKGRLLLVTACDGSMKTTAKFVSECVVCNNTLTIARGESGKQIAVSHRSVFNPTDTKQLLGLADGQFEDFMNSLRFLSAKKVGTVVADTATITLLANGVIPDKNPKAQDEIRATRGYKAIMDLFSGTAIASDMPGRGKTAWGWLNAVTEYADHRVSARSDDNRFNSSQFGAGDKMKNDALAIALAA